MHGQIALMVNYKSIPVWVISLLMGAVEAGNNMGPVQNLVECQVGCNRLGWCGVNVYWRTFREVGCNPLQTATTDIESHSQVHQWLRVHDGRWSISDYSIVHYYTSPMWTRKHCRISSPCFLAECNKRWLNQGIVLFCCVLCCLLFLGCVSRLVFVVSGFALSSVRIFQRILTWIALYSLIVLTGHYKSAHSLTHYYTDVSKIRLTLLYRSVKIGQTFKCHDMLMALLDDWRLIGAILCMILILTPFNIEKVHGKFVSALLFVRIWPIYDIIHKQHYNVCRLVLANYGAIF